METATGPGARRAVVVVLAGALAGALVYGVHDRASSPPRLTDPADTSKALAPLGASAGSPPSSPAATSPGTRSASLPQARAAAVAPSRVEVPSLGASLPVVPVGVDAARAMVIPQDPGTAGWYRFGPDPVTASGATVISAHTDTAGAVGPLSRLDQVRAGDAIRVSVGDERLLYVVRRVDRHAKESLDVDALFARTGPARLHLVSCGGAWDPTTRSYEDNVVAVATRVDEPNPTYSDPNDG